MPRSPALRGLLLAFGFSLLGGVGVAKDLGTFGTVWEIVEVDIRALLLAEASGVDEKQIQKALQDSAERYLDNLPKRRLNIAQQTRTRWIDPSFTLDEDIQAPIQNSTTGEWAWGVLHKKGTKFNPLIVQRPYNAMFFFDGTSEEQVKFAREVFRKYEHRVMLVEASGANPEKLAVDFGGPVFSATDAMLGRFQISAMPSALYPGEGPMELRLGLTEFASPFSTAAVERAWPGIRSPLTGAPK